MRNILLTSSLLLLTICLPLQTFAQATDAKPAGLWVLTRVPAGEPNNASFLVIAERVSSPAIKNGVDALRTMEAMAKNTSFLLEFQNGIRSETINGLEFGAATVKTTAPTGTFMQRIYMMVTSGYALEFFHVPGPRSRGYV